MILVTGAGGKTGKAVLKALVASGARARALVRSSAQEADVKAIGISEVTTGAIEDAGTLAHAVQGADVIYHICPNVSPHEVAFAKVVVAAAIDLGVPRFVYHSVLHPHIEAMPHHWNKLRVEEMLFSSGLDFTILQPSAYMQNSLAEWYRMKRDGVFRVPYPVETRLSLVDLDDGLCVTRVLAATLSAHDPAEFGVHVSAGLGGERGALWSLAWLCQPCLASGRQVRG